MERRAPAEYKRSGKEKARKDVAKMAAMDSDGDEGSGWGGGGRHHPEGAAGAQVLAPSHRGFRGARHALAFAWQKVVRLWPEVMVHFVLWPTFSFTMATDILLCFSLNPTIGLGIALIGFSIGTGLYACWVNCRTVFTAQVFHLSLLPTAKFPGLNSLAYLMLTIGFLWMSLWCFAVIGALNFYYSPLTIIALVLSLAWTAEVMRNVANLTVSRVIALYYLRGMQSNTQLCFHRALSINLGSACLGSLFIPSIEFLCIITHGLNLFEGEDEFLFSCAHCCLHVIESIFLYGNSGPTFTLRCWGRDSWRRRRAHGDYWDGRVGGLGHHQRDLLPLRRGGAICIIFAASWTFSSYHKHMATVSLLAFFVSYLMTRIGMALPHGKRGTAEEET